VTYATDLLDEDPVDLLDEWHHGDPVTDDWTEDDEDEEECNHAQ